MHIERTPHHRESAVTPKPPSLAARGEHQPDIGDWTMNDGKHRLFSLRVGCHCGTDRPSTSEFFRQEVRSFDDPTEHGGCGV